ncbi:rhodanese-related sulfurtransferase [Ammoniphilus resinae]|uniref:tRNA uridine(34) hydroxylase n=1 Tax=Ammoniphilus resinae TaxID=861532 RepID=A0ABS4GMZ7_9BACL|nr:rhodanese-related sulfurtransferase [Ammoniphilus resinae]MBP1931639.1 UPF0176 protein [Ammoniphilus resinae]
MDRQKLYRILLYYKFVPIEDPETFAKEHLKLCQQLDLKGRILVSHEGINGTVSGTVEQTQAYMDVMHQNPLFKDLWFKIDESEGHAFKKMHVRPREELVTFRVDEDLDPNRKTGKYLTPKEFFETMQQEDAIIIDGRNDYEYDIGHFRGAIRPEVQSFREFPDWIRENLSEHKDKKILTYCTGGIRCEKLTAWMLEEGFQDVAQLHGGIVTYGQDEEVKGRLWDGKCYVFDERIAVPINRTSEDIVIGKCYHCGNPADHYINCLNETCDRRHIVCPECMELHRGYCSALCKEEHTSK